MWMKSTKFKDLLHDCWEGQISSDPQLDLVLRLKKLKVALGDLNKEEFSHIKERTECARQTLNTIQMKCEEDPTNDRLREAEIKTRKKCIFLEEAEADFFKQKNRNAFLNFSDRNSKFFHSMVKRNNAYNTISFLCRDDDTTINDAKEIANSFVAYYTDLFGVKIQNERLDFDVLTGGRVVKEEENVELTRDVEDLEIKEALFDIANEKAPGPDGFPASFFKENWSTVGDLVLAAVKDFFSKGRLLREINGTVVTLIPKKSHCPRVSDYRPISCTNVIYKTITKIITRRLAPIMGDLINPAQSAFVKGRNITDNIFLAQELIRKYERKTGISSRCILKIDLQKAYDTVSWDYLMDILRGLNFHPKIIHWIMTCVTSPTYELAINGGVHGNIMGKRGLRQGDPMSPTLFLLCMEYLSRLLAERSKHPDFQFHVKCEENQITHLAFADDLLVLGKGEPASMRILADALNEFSRTSGLSINNLKSQIFMGGVRPYEKQVILDMFGFPLGELPVRYLGIPLASKRLNSWHYDPLISQFSSYINKWSNVKLSLAGRAELIRSVLQGVECYWLQVFPIPSSIVDRLTSLARKFLWGGRSCPVAWKNVCKPLDEGGLGFRDLVTWNRALLAKQIINFQENNGSLWTKWMFSEVLREKSIWEFQPSRDDSPLLKNLMDVRNRILQGCDNSIEGANAMLREWNSKNGTTAAYEFFREKGEKQFWHKAIWKSFIPPKFSITLWLGMQGRLKTVDRIRKDDVPKVCPLCKRFDETHDHLFFKCAKTEALWRKIRLWLGLKHRMTSLPSAIKHIAKEKKGSAILCKAKQITLAAMVNHIWYGRNLLVFENIPFDVLKIFKNIQRDVFGVLYHLFPVESVVAHMESNSSLV